MRSSGDHELGAFPQKHPDRNLQSPPAWVDDTDRPITHRVAISNNRLVSMDSGKVRFRWKDYVRREGAGG